ncbi:ABC transporter permease [Bacteroides sp.]|uniref:ABC transporter permease n=1 Tax=Bacteroides sp. TaxID=29523 RepID=UPI00263480D6|nr:ABC transporter permease [Bacteroides sp.]
MIKHYFKLALRNLLKYKMQSIISIIGLAVGFTCFALANLWIHYEVSYDSNPKGADRLYILYQNDPYHDSGYSPYMPYPLSTLLVNEFPEVEAACAYSRWKGIELQVEGQPIFESHEMIADSCMMNMFGITISSGNIDFMYSDEQIALTEETALRIFGTKDVLGKEIKVDGEKKMIGATLKDLKHSNLSFDFWGHGKYIREWQNEWSAGSFYIIIQLHKGVDPIAFQKKLASEKQNTDSSSTVSFEGIQLMPLNQYRNSSLNEEIPIRFNYLILFSVSGGLVILCSLFNYLSLFVTRMRMRNRETELRKVCGSTRSGLLILFATEYLMLILIAGAVGMALVEIVLPVFRKMSEVSGNIYLESLIFFVGVVFISILFLLPFILKRTYKSSNNKNEFRKVSIIFQLIISILFMFCMSVIMKQIFFLKDTDLGWDRKNIAVFPLLYPTDHFDEIADKVEQMSCTREVLKQHLGLLPKGGCLNLYINEWEGKPDSIKDINMMAIPEGEKLAKFYNLKLLKGEMVKEEDRKKVMINESAARALGLKEPVGEKIYWGDEQKSELTIVGLLKDFHTSPPTIPVSPILLIGENGTKASFWGKKQILIKYHEGQWSELKTKIENMFLQEYPDVRYKLVNVEDEYNQYLKSEDTLLKLLSFISFVCVLIAIFGIFSLVTLSCEQRRKEIAVRKVNGANIKDILVMFGKEYILLLVIASVIAFPVGYVLMKQWLQSYIEQTVISAWIYIAIFVGIAFIITICISWRVWQAARQNPAKTIKTE